MSDSTITSVSFPIPHNPNDKRPLPEIIAEHCGFPLASKPVEGKQFYAVQDWIAGVAQPASHPGTFWTHMKRRAKKAGIEFSSLCTKLPYTASDGKNYKIDYAEAEVLYRITQRMDANTGIREAVLHFLARAGVVVDEIRIDPEKAIEAAIEAYRRMGKTDAWISWRLRGKLARNKFTASLKQSLRTSPKDVHYAIITDTMRKGLWKRNTETLKQELGLKKNDSLRDNFSLIALSYETIAEEMSTYQLDQKRNLEFNQANNIVDKTSKFVGRQADEAGRMLGIDIPTGRPLLSDKSQKPTDRK